MKQKTIKTLKGIVDTYEEVIKVMDYDAKRALQEDRRAYGGFVRAAKGKIQEYITEQLILSAWRDELSQSIEKITINSDKIRIPIKKQYIDILKEKKVQDYILKHIEKYFYGLSVDKHIFVNGKLILGIECKAYTENAMIKRILVDFYLLKTKFPDLKCYLFQLESQLGGNYSKLIDEPPYGSYPTHSIMSYFDNVELKIVTLLKGERKVDAPINKPEHFKPLEIDNLCVALNSLLVDLQGAIK